MMDGSSPRIGGDDTPRRYAVLFAVGVVLGSAVRAVAWLVPAGLRARIKDRLP